MMKERPILFNSDMVNAILEGRKTQTRRANNLQVVNERPDDFELFDLSVQTIESLDFFNMTQAFFIDSNKIQVHPVCPYGKVGDQLWVRETLTGEMYASRTWSLEYVADGAEVEVEPPEDYMPPRNATETHQETGDNITTGGFSYWTCRVNSIFMPRWASRIQLEITDIRVERLNDISEDDCEAEGLKKLQGGIKTAFKMLWESINGKGSWDKNPWVWVVEFKRI